MKKTIASQTLDILKGGSGSGNFGHGGRIGEVGGSSSEGGEAKAFSYSRDAKFDQITRAPKGFRADENHTVGRLYMGNKEAVKTLSDSGFKYQGAGVENDKLYRDKEGRIAVVRDEKEGGTSVQVFRPVSVEHSASNYEDRLAENMGRRETRKTIGQQMADLYKGGSGSGNFGHEGRPGEKGGSGEGGGKDPYEKETSTEFIGQMPVGKNLQNAIQDLGWLAWNEGPNEVTDEVVALLKNPKFQEHMKDIDRGAHATWTPKYMDKLAESVKAGKGDIFNILATAHESFSPTARISSGSLYVASPEDKNWKTLDDVISSRGPAKR